MIFLFIIGVSGLLLGWKKNSNGILLSETMKGSTKDMKSWLSMHDLTNITRQFVIDSLHFTPIIDRIDIRPENGIIKYSFKDNIFGIQIDCATGKVLKVEKRYADLIEQIHDGSIIDSTFGWKSGNFKLIYTTIMSMGLMIFCVTGFWLWYGPKILKR
jgi:hypothetical protein